MLTVVGKPMMMPKVKLNRIPRSHGKVQTLAHVRKTRREIPQPFASEEVAKQGNCKCNWEEIGHKLRGILQM
jgi:hypothetical protein